LDCFKIGKIIKFSFSIFITDCSGHKMTDQGPVI
jgi:hypothetical protein